MHPNTARALALCDDLFSAPRPPSECGPLADDLLDFRDFGRRTKKFCLDGITYFVNEFWTAGQRKAHSIHEISYRACFKAQLPEFFIQRLTSPGDSVYDPFMGRGTTPVQAALMGRTPFANDINPLSTLLTRPRLKPPVASAVQAALADIRWDAPVDIREDLTAFYELGTLKNLTILRNYLIDRCPVHDSRPDPVLDWIRMVAINRLTGHSPGFFSVYTLPPNQAVSVESQLRINEKRQQVPPPRDVCNLILKKTRSLLSSGASMQSSESKLMTGDATKRSLLADDSVALVVTSPPFLDIVQYAADNWLRCWFAGIEPTDVKLSTHRTERAWAKMVRDTLKELSRVVRPRGHVAFEVGEVRRGAVLLERLVWTAAADLPFERIGVLVNDQKFTKTANCWGVSNNRGGTNTNRVVMLRRM